MRQTRKLVLWLACLALFAGPSAAAGDDDLSGEDVASATGGSTILLPVLGYTPDTGLLFGGLALRFFYLEEAVPEARPATFSPTVIYTLKNQILMFLGTTLNWDRNRNTLSAVPRYIKFPDRFYGIGRSVSLADEEEFTSESFGLDLEFSRQVWRNWRLGLGSELQKHRLDERESGGRLASGAINGTQDSWLAGLGPTLSLDNRDNTWAPDRGWWLRAMVNLAGSDLGSDFTTEQYTLDLRGYWTVGPDLVLAGQSLTTRIAGDPPFFALPKLGGEGGLRGYRGGLYLDRTRALIRAELRRSRMLGRVGGVVFLGIGDVAPAPAELTLAKGLWSAGFGFRYLLDENQRVNLRLDMGFGNGDSGFYMSLGEAF